ncbi:MAG: hypothetical protein D4S02_18585 [Rhodocyclaceae bacterium]|nr:MAG: hypothetical protein D4S02_18585 [Rhodocyclaceae bacterium]
MAASVISAREGQSVSLNVPNQQGRVSREFAAMVRNLACSGHCRTIRAEIGADGLSGRCQKTSQRMIQRGSSQFF